MFSEIRTRSGWGDHHSYIEDALACCVDYVGRLRRSLAGEIAPDRHYFLERRVAGGNLTPRLSQNPA